MPLNRKQKQNIFDIAVKGVIGQGGVSRRMPRVDGGIAMCVYDDGRGNHCAIGHVLKEKGVAPGTFDMEQVSVGICHVIPAYLAGGRVKDEDLESDDLDSDHEKMVADAAAKLLTALQEKLGPLSLPDLEFLQRLQVAHDACNELSLFRGKMNRLAANEGLDASLVYI
jgi:hypothetical protein